MAYAVKNIRVAPLVLLVAMLVAGCASPPPPPPPGVIELTLQAAADINPDASGQAAPVVVRVYHLASPEKFSVADFFSLFDNDKAALGPDLISRDEVSLTPGQTRTLTTPLEPKATIVGVVAAFRDIDHATWRASIAVPENGTTKLQANLTHLKVDLTKPAPPKPAS